MASDVRAVGTAAEKQLNAPDETLRAKLTAPFDDLTKGSKYQILHIPEGTSRKDIHRFVKTMLESLDRLLIDTIQQLHSTLTDQSSKLVEHMKKGDEEGIEPISYDEETAMIDDVEGQTKMKLSLIRQIDAIQNIYGKAPTTDNIESPKTPWEEFVVLDRAAKAASSSPDKGDAKA